jgi:ribosomal silencing factor RsfS
MVVHIFTPSARSYYDFDRLYRDAPAIDKLQLVERESENA